MKIGEWHARTITIVCARDGHPEITIGELTSGLHGTRILSAAFQPTDELPPDLEYWDAAGQHIILQEGVRSGQRRVTGLLAADVASRYIFQCPECGLNVEAGNRLGGATTRPGYGAVFETAMTGDADPMRRGVTESFATDSHLTKLADSGVSRLSLSGLGVIFQL